MELLRYLLFVFGLFALAGCASAVHAKDRMKAIVSDLYENIYASPVMAKDGMKVIVSDDYENIYVSAFNMSHEVISANKSFGEGYIYTGSVVEFDFSPVNSANAPSRFSGGEHFIDSADDFVVIYPRKSIGSSFLKCYISYLFSLSDGEYYLNVKYSPFKWDPLVSRKYYVSDKIKVNMRKCSDIESGIIKVGDSAE